MEKPAENYIDYVRQMSYKQQRIFSCDIVEYVLPIFTHYYPDDPYVSDILDAIRNSIENDVPLPEISLENNSDEQSKLRQKYEGAAQSVSLAAYHALSYNSSSTIYKIYIVTETLTPAINAVFVHADYNHEDYVAAWNKFKQWLPDHAKAIL